MWYVIVALAAYLLGSSNMAFYLEKLMKKNVRGGGSGNLGASNAVILLGWKAGVLVGIHDIGKAMLAVWLSQWLLPEVPYIGVVAGVACVLGHIFPFYLKFKGGKGFASFVGMVIALNWKVAIAMVVMIVVVTWVTDYIVAATLSSIISLPIAMGSVNQSLWVGLIVAVASIVIGVKHHENLKRIFITGTEIGFRNASTGKHRIKE